MVRSSAHGDAIDHAYMDCRMFIGYAHPFRAAGHPHLRHHSPRSRHGLSHHSRAWVPLPPADPALLLGVPPGRCANDSPFYLGDPGAASDLRSHTVGATAPDLRLTCDLRWKEAICHDTRLSPFFFLPLL